MLCVLSKKHTQHEMHSHTAATSLTVHAASSTSASVYMEGGSLVGLHLLGYLLLLGLHPQTQQH